MSKLISGVRGGKTMYDEMIDIIRNAKEKYNQKTDKQKIEEYTESLDKQILDFKHAIKMGFVDLEEDNTCVRIDSNVDDETSGVVNIGRFSSFDSYREHMIKMFIEHDCKIPVTVAYVTIVDDKNKTVKKEETETVDENNDGNDLLSVITKIINSAVKPQNVESIDVKVSKDDEEPETKTSVAESIKQKIGNKRDKISAKMNQSLLNLIQNEVYSSNDKGDAVFVNYICSSNKADYERALAAKVCVKFARENGFDENKSYITFPSKGVIRFNLYF